MMSIRAAPVLVTFVAAMTMSAWSARAQPRIDATVGGLVSVQPGGYDGTGGPYLDESLDGTVLGFTAGVDLAASSGAMLTVELSSTSALEQVQRGRFVVGLGPSLARHQDTLVSVLPGFRARWPNGGSFEPKGGLSFVVGTPEREAHVYDDPAGTFALTVGADVVLPVTARIAVVPALRYSHVYRGADALYFGLGDEILRIGVGIRFGP